MVSLLGGGGKKSVARVLIAEDDTAVREFVSRALAHGGHEVATAEDGLEALSVLNGSTFDLLVTDIVMPNLDGIALALKVAKDYPAMPVLLMTGYAAERQRAHNLDVLIHDVITKPFTLNEICEAAEEALASHEPATAP
ncbi:MAG: two-component system cell cycle response regulator CpdR [Alphaproteobacteria bacterium]